MTEFRQRLRYQQAQWREANEHPIGSQPIAPRPGAKARSVGSRLPLAYARETGANFLNARAFEAARARASYTERNQSFDHQRLWADLLWSPALAVNLFGDLAADVDVADRALHAWLPDAPGTVRDVRFTHSPGWLDPEYLNSLRAFDAAFVLDLGSGANGIVAVDVKYHEWSKPEIAAAREPAALPRGRGEVGRVRARSDLRARGPVRPRRDVARAPAPAVDAPAPERALELGTLRRRPPGGQLGHRRCLRSLSEPPRGRLDILVADPRSLPRLGRSSRADGSRPQRPLLACLSGSTPSGRCARLARRYSAVANWRREGAHLGEGLVAEDRRSSPTKRKRPRLRLRGRFAFEATPSGAASRRIVALRPSHARPAPASRSGGGARASDLASDRLRCGPDYRSRVQKSQVVRSSDFGYG